MCLREHLCVDDVRSAGSFFASACLLVPSGVGGRRSLRSQSSGELVVVYLGRSRVVLVQPLTHLAVAWALSEDLLYFVWVFIVRTTPDLRTKSYAFHAFSLLRPPHTRRPARSTFLEPHNCTPLTPLHYNSQALPLLSSLMYEPLCSP